MLIAKKYIEGDLTQKINSCAVEILRKNPDLSKFHMKIKIESQKRYKITLHGNYQGVSLCASDLGLDIWLTFKMVENKFLKQLKKAKLIKRSKVIKMRNKFERIQGGASDNDESNFTI